MNKECQPSPPMRKRRTPSGPPSKKRSELEEKIDGLVSLVRSATQGPPAIPNATIQGSSEYARHPNYGSGSASTPASSVNNVSNIDTMSFTESRFTPLPSSFSSPASSSIPGGNCIEPGIDEAESYLDKFRNDFVNDLPFLIIPKTMTAVQLRNERPMLWMSIMNVSSNISTQQIAWSEALRSRFGREAFVEGTRSLDFLLAVLVYVIW